METNNRTLRRILVIVFSILGGLALIAASLLIAFIGVHHAPDSPSHTVTPIFTEGDPATGKLPTFTSDGRVHWDEVDETYIQQKKFIADFKQKLPDFVVDRTDNDIAALSTFVCFDLDKGKEPDMTENRIKNFRLYLDLKDEAAFKVTLQATNEQTRDYINLAIDDVCPYHADRKF